MTMCSCCFKDGRRVIAVAVCCTESGDLYKQSLYSNEEIDQVKAGTHPEIGETDRAIIVHGDLSSEDFT